MRFSATGGERPHDVNASRNRDLDQNAIDRALLRALPTYGDASTVQRHVADALCSRLDMLRQSPASILDIGAADGYLAAQMQSRFAKAEVIALDKQKQILAQGNGIRQALNTGLTPAQVVADACSMPFSEQRFDVMVSNLLLHWLPDPQEVLSHWRGFLKPGGSLWLTTLGPDSLLEMKQVFSGLDNFTHVHHFMDMHPLADFLQAAGYCDPVTDVQRLHLKYKTMDRLLHDLKHTGCQCASFNRPNGLYGRRRWQQMLNNYEALRDDEGLLPVTLEVIFAHASVPVAGQSLSSADDDSGEVHVSIDQIGGLNRS